VHKDRSARVTELENVLQFNTFSIVARCARTGELGIAIATAVPAVGALCPFIVAGVGAVATQAWVNPYLAMDALDHMQNGMRAAEALQATLKPEPLGNLRQVGVVDAKGGAASFSGADCLPYAGHRLGEGLAIQGNMLKGPETLDAMQNAFATSPELNFSERLMRALEAGQAAGGDVRGKQSAALKIYSTEAYPLLDLRVDEHASPVAELRRVLGIARLQLLPFMAGVPRRNRTAAEFPEHDSDVLLVSPPLRPGGGGSGP
jgi:uncharacterized Ntn-hydrolase superfamily protein